MEANLAAASSGDRSLIRKAAYDAMEAMKASVERLARAEGPIRLLFQKRGFGYHVRPRTLVKADPGPLSQDDSERVDLMAQAVHDKMVSNISVLAGARRFIVSLDPRTPGYNIEFEFFD